VKLNVAEGYTRFKDGVLMNMPKDKITKLRMDVHVIDKHNDNKVIKRPGYLIDRDGKEFIP